MFEFRKRSTIQKKKIRLRVLIALLFVLGCFGLLVNRLWVLQVERYQGLSERADRNRIALVPIAPRRGDI
ncbi:MAG: penicillin-binding protein 2, partial [Advenella sp.]